MTKSPTLIKLLTAPFMDSLVVYSDGSAKLHFLLECAIRLPSRSTRALDNSTRELRSAMDWRVVPAAFIGFGPGVLRRQPIPSRVSRGCIRRDARLRHHCFCGINVRPVGPMAVN
jgi:hypothetical protein